MSPLRLNLSPTEPRECTSCGHFLPARHFPPPITQDTGYITVRRCCRACLAARQRKGRPPGNRKPKRNAAGLYHCPSCRTYLPAESFGRNKGKVAAYCRPCARKLGRETWRAILADPERAPVYIEKKRLLQDARRKRIAHERKATVEFAGNAVKILRRRGLTKSQICQLGGFSHSVLDRWEHARVSYCKVEAIQRLTALMRATAFLPVQATYPVGTPKRHPEWDRIVEELRWEMAEL